MNVFIGCSSRENIPSVYKNSACKLAEYLSSKDYNLIVGGIDGIMGSIKDIFLKNKKDVIIMSVIGYYDVEDTTLKVYHYNNVSDRKYSLINNSNLIILLPGGLGTIDEIFTSIESKRANEHDNDIIIVNFNNYYDDLIKQLNKMYKEKFADSYNKELYYIADNIDEVIPYIEEECMR